MGFSRFNPSFHSPAVGQLTNCLFQEDSYTKNLNQINPHKIMVQFHISWPKMKNIVCLEVLITFFLIIYIESHYAQGKKSSRHRGIMSMNPPLIADINPNNYILVSSLFLSAGVPWTLVKEWTILGRFLRGLTFALDPLDKIINRRNTNTQTPPTWRIHLVVL